jgi:hypothetical protein
MEGRRAEFGHNATKIPKTGFFVKLLFARIQSIDIRSKRGIGLFAVRSDPFVPGSTLLGRQAHLERAHHLVLSIGRSHRDSYAEMSNKKQDSIPSLGAVQPANRNESED